MNEGEYSPAMKAMIARKKIMRTLNSLDQNKDRENYDRLKEKARSLLEIAENDGGITAEESQILSLVH